jgi:hypothetical protein
MTPHRNGQVDGPYAINDATVGLDLHHTGLAPKMPAAASSPRTTRIVVPELVDGIDRAPEVIAARREERGLILDQKRESLRMVRSATR